MHDMTSMENAGADCVDQHIFESLREIVGDETLASLIGMFMDESRQMAVDIEAAMDADDLASLERHVHLLKGVSSNFGLHRIVDTANAAMAACREERRTDAHAIAATLPGLTEEARNALTAFSEGLA